MSRMERPSGKDAMATLDWVASPHVSSQIGSLDELLQTYDEFGSPESFTAAVHGGHTEDPRGDGQQT